MEEQLCQKCKRPNSYLMQHCPQCGACSDQQEVRNYSVMWHDGDVHCTKCGGYVRAYDAD